MGLFGTLLAGSLLNRRRRGPFGIGSYNRGYRGRHASAGLLSSPLAGIALSSLAAYGARRYMASRHANTQQAEQP